MQDSNTVDHRGQVRNLLHLDNLSRESLDATFTCRAANNNITRPLDTTVTISMTREYKGSLLCKAPSYSCLARCLSSPADHRDSLC